jgi:hypothetical protein
MLACTDKISAGPPKCFTEAEGLLPENAIRQVWSREFANLGGVRTQSLKSDRWGSIESWLDAAVKEGNQIRLHQRG